jgi:nucleotide-binding universal stress UspA family protein
VLDRLRRRKEARPRVARVLVATDRSETAGRAVDWAAEMAARYEAELLVLRVTLDGDTGALESDLSEYAAELGENVRPLVRRAEDPAEGICAAAREEDADVLVVGSVGMQGRKEFLLGNVPNRVSHNAPCTVVIVDTTAE